VQTASAADDDRVDAAKEEPPAPAAGGAGGAALPQAHGRLPPQPAAGFVLDHHVAQPRPDAPADPPGMAAAVLYLALDAALVILAQVRQPGQDNGGAGRRLHY
jgi:hypothetical protein